VSFTRKHRFLNTFLYQIPTGRGGKFFTSAGRGLDAVIGGWELAGVYMIQSGPFMTVTVPGADPSGTGFPLLVGNGRADAVNGVSPYLDNPTPQAWLNKAAFAVPGTNIGRWPTSGVGQITGPGTNVLSLSMTKSITITERIRLQLGAQAANLLNHVNYAVPNTTFNTANFGTINNVQTAEGAGPRQMQLTGRVTF
jgi:hypothetical protein